MKNELAISFGKRIKELRKKQGSQEKVAEKIGISPRYLSRLETGQHFPSAKILNKLANALDLEVMELFEFGEVTYTSQELKRTLNKFISKMKEDDLRLLLKITKLVFYK